MQIKSLLKKNVKIHMRTNALPCCSCTLISACLLHFCCPIFFVLCATFVPWVIIKSTLNEREAKDFLEVQVDKPKIFKRWPGFDAPRDYRFDGWQYGHEIDLTNPRLLEQYPPMGAISMEYSLWAPKSYRYFDWFSGSCAAALQGCHCKTLALIGPTDAVVHFKAFLQREVDRYWAHEAAVKASEREALRTFNVDLKSLSNHSRRLASEDEPGSAGALDSALRSLEYLRKSIAETVRATPGAVADFLDPATGLRRLSNASAAPGNSRSSRRDAFRDCESNLSPIPESEYCDVDAGHNGTIFRTFASLKELDRFVDASEYGRYPRDRSESSAWDRLCGAVVLENDVLSAAVPAYAIRLNVTEKNVDGGSITSRRNEPVQHETTAVRFYVRSGFLYLQHLMHAFLAERRGGAPPALDLLRGEPHVVPASTQEERNWEFGTVVGAFLSNPLILCMMFGPIVSSIAFYISRERATRQKELMRMMGLSDSSLLWSWVLMFVAFNFFISLAMTILFMVFFFIKSNFFIVWMLIFWFSNASTAFGMFVAALITSERSAAMNALGMFMGITSLTTAVAGPTKGMGAKALVSLLPPDGFFLTMAAIWDWEIAGLGATFSTSNAVTQNYSVALGIWMQFLSFWLFLLLYYYIDNVAFWHNVGVARRPWFCCLGSYWREMMGKPPDVGDAGDASLEEGRGDVEGDPKYFEAEEDVHLKEMVQSNRCVIIRKLNKSFVNAAGEKVSAVKDLSFTMYQDECFCLLGHNGAGKTTTMMMLTGCLPQSGGQIKVKGCKVPEQLRAIRTSMGFCPQHNVLFNELSVFEHLELFGALGGMSPKHIQQRGAELVAAVALTDKMHTRAAALSGGMKRKLSAALAFLSKPYLVILDEPSSGMDPFARRGMWNTLKQWRTGHILCLTTHYMDEADALGDRIAIMSKGQLACKGSSTFLKRQFGCGYVISFAKVDDQQQHNPRILAAVQAVVGGEAQIMSAVGKELLVQVPFAAAEKFATLFPQIDAGKAQLGIESYGTSITNLEEVFLKVARLEKKGEEQKPGGQASAADAATWASPEAAPPSLKQASFTLQLGALLIRRFKFAYRNRGSCICQIGLPMMCLFAFCLITVMTTVTALDPLVLDMSRWNLEVEAPRVPVMIGTMQGGSAALRSEVQAMWTNASGIDAVRFADVAPASYPSTPPAGADSIVWGNAEESGFAQAMLANERRHAASQYGGLLYPDHSSWCPGSYPSVCPAVGVTIMVNLTAPHAGPALFNAHAAAVLRRRSTGITNIQVTNHPFQNSRTQISRMEFVSGILTAIIIMAAYGFVPSGVTSYVVMEKEKDVKNQLIISGCSYAAYWVSNFLFDVLWGLIPAIGAWITFFVFGLRSYTTSPGVDASIALFIAFMPAMAGFAYLFSFLFSKSGVALFFSWMFNLSVGILATITISILRSIPGAYDAMVALRWIFRMVPVFSLGYGHLLIGVFQQRAEEQGVGALAGIGVGGGACEDPANVRGVYKSDERCIFMVGDEFLMLVLCGIFYVSLTIAADTVFGLPVFKRMFGAGPGLSGKVMDSQEDEMVLEEKKRVNEVSRASQFVFVQDVHKVYKRGFHAVRGISFAASDGQVFGLLGVNGAGKTTTFKMLCGQVEPTAGQICIQGYDVTTQTAQARRLIGYCPQFDALLDSLTTREHLYLYGRLKGLAAGGLGDAVAQQLSDLDLNSYVRSRAGQLSGGNKRKLSVAMATIGEPPMVFLDEPSAGMDPVARRGMWSVIQNIADKRKRSVVILTTHSMEEAEALCSRIAIQVDGQFRCLGTAQQIKSRYGQGLELNVRLATPTPQEIADACTKMGGTGSQLIAAQLAAGRVEAAFDKAAVDELQSRPGSPLQGGGSVPLAVLAECAILATRTKAFEAFLIREFKPEANGQPCILSLDKSQNVLRYQVLAAALQGRFRSLGTIFSLFQEHKEALSMEDFQVSQTSLEQVFNKFATSQASQSGAGPPPAAAPAGAAAAAGAAGNAATADAGSPPEPVQPQSPPPPPTSAPTTVVATTRPTPPGTPEASQQQL